MPLLICDIHGASSGVEVCQHLGAAFNQGKHLTHSKLPVFRVRMCQNCFEQYDISQILEAVKIDKQEVHDKKKKEKGIRKLAPDYYFEIELLEEKHPKLLKQLQNTYDEINKNSKINCVSCLEMVELNQARKQGLELPFEPFENTILHSDDERLSKLEILLNKEVERKGKYLPKLSATYEMTRNCVVWSGTGKRPVTIKFHGFTELEDQKRLLFLIDDFFKNIKEYQRKVVFYKSLNWIHTTLENGMKRRTRDQKNEILIREIIVR